MIRSPKLLLVFAVAVVATGCKPDSQPDDLGTIDVSANRRSETAVFVKPKTEEEIRKAYAEYLSSTDENDRFRVDALSRLAELELSASQAAQQRQAANAEDESAEIAAANAKLHRTIDLLSASLRAYPKAPNNDVLLYQMAKAHAQLGEAEQSIENLRRLVEEYPGSPFYPEAQFRIAEDAFSRRDYKHSEYAYTEVIISPRNEVFHEKALFKRGWSLFKQAYYKEALNDFFDAIALHGFGSQDTLNKPEMEQFNEYIRAVGLSFGYLGGAKEISAYMDENPSAEFVYETYAAVGGIYAQQERFSDAAKVFKEFIGRYPQSDKIPYARLKVIEIWQKSGFDRQVHAEIERFFLAYNPSSSYWKQQNQDASVNRVVRRSLQKYVILMAGYYHNRYQQSGSEDDFEHAELWYKRYFEFYGTYAQRDNVAFLYAELMSQSGQYERAITYYEIAAFQDGLVVNKDAAYASVYTSDKLFAAHPARKEYLEKLVKYASRFARAYPKDERTNGLLSRAAQLAYGAHEYKTAIELSDLYLTSQGAGDTAPQVTDIKAQSYFALGEFAEAERLYGELIGVMPLPAQELASFKEKWALAIYRQGESADRGKDFEEAVFHWARISNTVPDASIAATGLYDAIALEMQNQRWNEAIALIQRFQALFPDHKLKIDVAKKLSAAYLNTDQSVRAAKEFEKLSAIESDVSTKAAALWRAAEIYVSKGEIADAVHAYEEYVRQFRKPFPQYMEAMYQLAELNGQTESASVAHWLERIVEADRAALNNVKTDRTKYIVSSAFLKLANTRRAVFDAIELRLPLKDSLRQKKAAMEEAVRLYGMASRYRVFEVVSEATYHIATIYGRFSRSLLDSERPKNLNEEELNQYEILLEDQAFPFEDKAIEFHELNIARTADGHFNNWIGMSRNALVELFPERYKREPKEDVYVSQSN
jgi:tetratricopeptide (TPR) repeat protein